MDLLTLAVLAAQATAPLPPSGPVAVERLPLRAELPTPPALPSALTRVPAADTAFEYSAAYYRRLDIHRIGSYAMLPLFAFQYYAGSRLYDGRGAGEDWAETGHGIAAAGVAALFASNTITGVMNLYEGRKDPDGRGRRVFHATMMILADAGFTATGLLAEEAEEGGDPSVHRTVALTSMGIATIGYLSMLDIFRGPPR